MEGSRESTPSRGRRRRLQMIICHSVYYNNSHIEFLYFIDEDFHQTDSFDLPHLLGVLLRFCLLQVKEIIVLQHLKIGG